LPVLLVLPWLLVPWLLVPWLPVPPDVLLPPVCATTNGESDNASAKTKSFFIVNLASVLDSVPHI
jgi:hypothetical protein